MNERGYAIMELRKTGERLFTHFTSRATAARMLAAYRTHCPTRRFQLIEWRVVELSRREA
jgi:hypothetical protein